MPPRPAVCVFCRTRPSRLSGEHIWDDWLNRRIGPNVAGGHLKFVERDHAGLPIRQYPTARINWKVKAVCEACNTGWMSDLSGEVSRLSTDAIIRGRKLTLLPDGLELLAAFAFMKSVVTDRLSVNRNEFFGADALRRFRRKRAIPDGTQVWLGSFASPAASGRLHVSYARIKGGGGNGLELHTFTYVVGNVVLQVVNKRWAVRRRRREEHPVLRQNHNWAKGIAQIWPNVGAQPVVWPIGVHIDDSTLMIFHDRWLSLNEVPAGGAGT